MIKVIKDSTKEEPKIIDYISDRINEIGFEIVNKGQDFTKDIYLKIQTKDTNKTSENLAQARTNLTNILKEVSEKYNIDYDLKLILKSTGYIDGTIKILDAKSLQDSYEYFGTEKLKQLAKVGGAELLKSDGKKEYNDEYYIVINNKKERLDADSDKSAIKLFKEMFNKKNLVVTDSIDGNNDIINSLQIAKDYFLKGKEACQNTINLFNDILATTDTEMELYNDISSNVERTLVDTDRIISMIEKYIISLHSAHIQQDQPLKDFSYECIDRLKNGEKFEELLTELETIYNNMNDVDKKYYDEYEYIQKKIMRANNIIARKKVK